MCYPRPIETLCVFTPARTKPNLFTGCSEYPATNICFFNAQMSPTLNLINSKNMSDTRFLRCYWELLLEGGNKETLRKILRDLFPEQPDETKLSQLIQKITLFISILNLPYLCTAEVTLLSGLLPVRRRAETVEPAISLLKLVHRCCSTEQVILKFLPLVTTAQLQTYSLTTLAAKVTVPSVLSQLASSVTPVSVGLLVSREEDEGNNE